MSLGAHNLARKGDTRRDELLALASLVHAIKSNPRENLRLSVSHFAHADVRDEVEHLFETGAMREPASVAGEESLAEYTAATTKERVAALTRVRGTDLAGRPATYISAVASDKRDDEIGDSEDWTAQQVDAAIANLDVDPSTLPRWPWPELDKMLGPIDYGRLNFIAAASSQGKTAFTLSMVEALIKAGTGVYFCGLESEPKELRTKLACLAIGLDPVIVLERRWKEVKDWDRVRADLIAAYRNQRAEPMRSLVSFDPRRAIGYDELRDALTRAVDQGKRIVIVDHVDRLVQGPGVNLFAEMSAMVKYASDLAVEHELVLLMTTQMNGEAYRGSRIAVYSPPQIHHLHMGGTKRFEAHTVIGLYRPRRVDATKEELRAVEAGDAEPQTILMPGTMGIRIMKHRSNGSMEGRQCYLGVEGGRVVSIPERDRYVTSPTTRGPRP